jgi:hypothetical protein
MAEEDAEGSHKRMKDEWSDEKIPTNAVRIKVLDGFQLDEFQHIGLDACTECEDFNSYNAVIFVEIQDYARLNLFGFDNLAIIEAQIKRVVFLVNF